MKAFKSDTGYCSNFFSRQLGNVGVLISILVSSGCVNFYKINTVKETSIIDSLQNLKNTKQFIIHLKDTSFSLNNLSVSENLLKGKLEPLLMVQVKYLHPKSTNKNRYYKAEAWEVLKEIHLYAENQKFSDTANFSLPVSAITRADINIKNKEATTRSHVFGGLIVIVAMLAVLAAVAGAALSGFNYGG